MSNIAPRLDRNRAFAADPGARQGMPRLPFIPNLNLNIVTCIDCRVDPAQVLGVKLGEALVQRNIGGRITPAIIADMPMPGIWSTPRLPKAPTSRWRSSTTPIAAPPCWPTTTCATDSLSASAPTSGPWPTPRSWTRPRTVTTDVNRVLWAEEIPQNVHVSGHVYDIGTGLVTTIVDARGKK